MDRGVKVAIFVASVVSLGLGLIWDQVLSHARVVVEEKVADELGPEVIDARMGSPDILRLELAEDLSGDAPSIVVESSPKSDAKEDQSQPAKSPDVGWKAYTVRDGDSYWRIANVEFKSRDLSSQDIKDANPGIVLHPGEILQIPPGKDAVKRESNKLNSVANVDTGEWADYVVKDGDSWWKIAHVHFKNRNLQSADIEKANKNVSLRPGKTVRIPPGK